MSEKRLFHEIPKSADFHSVVMTTYSFDFHYFESQVLRVLKSNGIININVFADTSMLDQSIGFSTGYLKSLSTLYSINAIPCVGAFHPKITFLAGENDVLLLQGSGNITNGGHGKNHEVFSVFYANQEDRTQLPLIQEAWNYIRRLTNRIEGLSADKLNWVSDNCNLIEENAVEPHQLHEITDDFSAALLYNEDSSIWQQLVDLVPSDTINNIKIFSPFYDEKGTFLKQLASHYSKSTIQAFLQPDKGIHPFKMDTTERISFLSWESTNRAKATIAKFDRKLHSKIIWFDAGGEYYGLFGSSNATIKAFGSENNRGANDEFAVLLKVQNKSILEELQLTGEFELWKPQEILQEKENEENAEIEQAKNVRKIKIVGVDQENKRITVFVKDVSNNRDVNVVFYNNWGEELERINCMFTGSVIKLELQSQKSFRAAVFVQLEDFDGVAISNKQIINRLNELWNTNPSSENRRLMKLGGLLESGENKLFDVIKYFNEIQSEKNNLTKKSSRGSSNSENSEEEKAYASISYDDAITLNKEEKANQHLLQHHSSIKIWDAIERYFKELANSEQDEDMDDEEGGDATSSRDRKFNKPRTGPIPLNSDKVIHDRRRSIEKFLNNYLKAIRKSAEIENHQIDSVDMAMMLIVLKHLVEFTEREVILKDEPQTNERKVLFPLNGNLSELTSFSGALLNVLGSFVSFLANGKFYMPSDEFLLKKMLHYKNEVKKSCLFCLALVHNEYQNHFVGQKGTSIIALNILEYFGVFEQEFENDLDEFLKNVSVQNLHKNKLIEYINSWVEMFNNSEQNRDIVRTKNLGICWIEKCIPTIENPKFLKLSRPGFDYDEDIGDFILDKLYNFHSGKLFRTKESLKKEK